MDIKIFYLIWSNIDISCEALLGSKLLILVVMLSSCGAFNKQDNAKPYFLQLMFEHKFVNFKWRWKIKAN